MKLIISSSELLRGVMAVAKAIPAKSPLPILENFLFDLKGNKLEITASDSELTLKTQIEVENTAEEGRIAVPAKHMMDLLKELPDQPLTINTTSDSSFVCSWASGESTLPYFPAEDYPEITGTDETAVTLQFPAQSLVDGISSTIYATADDEIRPAMNGILFDIDLASTTLVASDSHKLICYTTKDVQASEKASFILHKKPAAILKAIIGKDAETYTDIITFDYVEGDVVSGDILISVDRIKDNAQTFGCTFEQELHRVIIHGILHLLGVGDKTDEEAKIMRKREEEALKVWDDMTMFHEKH